MVSLMMKPPARKVFVLFLATILLSTEVVNAAREVGNTHVSAVNKLFTKTRRVLNLSSLFGSPLTTKSSTVFDRIVNIPVFQVTTSWGSPFLSMERRTKNDPIEDDEDDPTSDDRKEFKTVGVYYTDIEDALNMLYNMKNIKSMKDYDVRITTVSLGRAIRMCSALGGGMPTGQPFDKMTGVFKKKYKLRHKIQPSQRQLFYAARCIGKERLGFTNGNVGADALKFIDAGENKKRASKEEMIKAKKERAEQQEARMEGGSKRAQDRRAKAEEEKAAAEAAEEEAELPKRGIPVFFSPQLMKVQPLVKQVMSGVKEELPMFHDYEDLQEAWTKMRESTENNDSIPREAANVEVFNLWDLLVAMEKDKYEGVAVADESSSGSNDGPIIDQWKRRLTASVKNNPIKKRLSVLTESKTQKDARLQNPNLSSIIFIPSSKDVTYKEGITKKGNNKARLPPMR